MARGSGWAAEYGAQTFGWGEAGERRDQREERVSVREVQSGRSRELISL